jgi:uncharacterized membrane protein
MTTPASHDPGAPSSTAGDREKAEKRDLEVIIHALLVWGVALSSTIMVAGLLVAAITGQPLPDSVPPIQQVIPEALALRPGGILALGLLILIATPILRVASSIIAFIYERDWRYTLITTIVFLIVLASIFLGGE